MVMAVNVACIGAAAGTREFFAGRRFPDTTITPSTIAAKRANR